MRYMGIDFGSKDVGVALSDEGGSMAFPYDTLSNNAGLVAMLAKIVTEQKVDAVVMGHSVNHQGKDNPIMERARQCAGALEEMTGIAIYFEPEHYTSKEAARTQGENKHLDASAAAIILNSFLAKKNPKSVLDD